MKCDECVNLLEVYLDGEAGERNSEHVREHFLSTRELRDWLGLFGDLPRMTQS